MSTATVGLTDAAAPAGRAHETKRAGAQQRHAGAPRRSSMPDALLSPSILLSDSCRLQPQPLFSMAIAAEAVRLAALLTGCAAGAAGRVNAGASAQRSHRRGPRQSWAIRRGALTVSPTHAGALLLQRAGVDTRGMLRDLVLDPEDKQLQQLNARLRCVRM